MHACGYPLSFYLHWCVIVVKSRRADAGNFRHHGGRVGSLFRILIRIAHSATGNDYRLEVGRHIGSPRRSGRIPGLPGHQGRRRQRKEPQDHPRRGAGRDRQSNRRLAGLAGRTGRTRSPVAAEDKAGKAKGITERLGQRGIALLYQWCAAGIVTFQAGAVSPSGKDTGRYSAGDSLHQCMTLPAKQRTRKRPSGAPRRARPATSPPSSPAIQPPGNWQPSLMPRETSPTEAMPSRPPVLYSSAMPCPQQASAHRGSSCRGSHAERRRTTAWTLSRLTRAAKERCSVRGTSPRASRSR